MTRDYRTSPKHHGLAVSHAFHARQADPANTPPPQHRQNRATRTDEAHNTTTPARPNPAPTRNTPHACGRAPGQPAGRAPFPTNRHEGGSLT